MQDRNPVWEDKVGFSPYPLLPDHVQALLARVPAGAFLSSTL